MKTIQSEPINITENIFGKITFSPKKKKIRSQYIYCFKDGILPSISGYAGIISYQNREQLQIGNCIIKDRDSLHEGDVVLIEKNGSISKLYDSTSSHNAIFATEKCNHRCIMCPQPPIEKEENKTQFNLKLIQLLDRKITNIGITGGEPTLIGDDLFLLINKIKTNLPEASITILSNGVQFANKEYALKLALYNCKNLQIDIPIFSDISSIHNHIVGAKTFYKTVQGLYNLALFKQRIGIRIVIHKLTYKRLPQLSAFIYHNFPFVTQVAFMQMETTGMAKENLTSLWIDPYDYNKQLEEAVLYLSDRKMNPCIYNAQLCILPPSIRSFAQQTISDWKDIYLPECTDCTLKAKCGGFFESNKEHHSQHIKSIRENTNPKI